MLRHLAVAFAAAFGVAAHAATGKAPLPAFGASPLTAEPARVDGDAYRRAYGSRSGHEFDVALAADLDAAMSGAACNALLPLAEALATQEPQRLGPHFVRMRCALKQGHGVDIADALRTAFLAAVAAAERPSAEFHPDRVVAVASLVDAYVYLLAKRETIAASTFEIAGGGRRLYYVVAAQAPDGGRESIVRFDLAGLMRATLAQLGTGSLEYPDMPALEFARLLATQPELRGQARTGIALFAAGFPGTSLAHGTLRDALAQAADAQTNPDVHYASLWLAYAWLADVPPGARVAELAQVAAARLADGDVLLAALAEQGVGVEKSRRARDAALDRAARRIGMPAAQQRLAQLLARAGSPLYDAARSADWQRLAARGGDAVAQWQYGASLCFAASSSRCDVAWFERAAKQGATTATRLLGRAYLTGTGVPRDAARARGYYEAALAGGDENAAGTLGEIHANGDGVPRDRARATELFRRGARFGDPRAQASLALALREGASSDAAESLRWFKAAAQQGERRGFTGWGRALEEGRGVDKDEALARGMYAWSADAGDREAMRRLAAMLREGRGGDTDAAQADAWLQRADQVKP